MMTRIFRNIVKLGVKSRATTPQIEPPFNQIINNLLNFPVEEFVEIWLPNQSTDFLDQLTFIFDGLIKYLAPSGKEPLEEAVFGCSIDELVLPITMALTKMASNPIAKARMRTKFLPVNIDRAKPLNEGESITASFVRAMTSIRLYQIKDAICDLLIKLLDDDRNLF